MWQTAQKFEKVCFFSDSVSHWDLRIMDWTSLAGQQVLGTFCLHSPRTGVTIVCWHTWLCTRVLGIKFKSSYMHSSLPLSLCVSYLSFDCIFNYIWNRYSWKLRFSALTHPWPFYSSEFSAKFIEANGEAKALTVSTPKSTFKVLLMANSKSSIMG